MTVPVARPYMDFDVADPQMVPDFHLGVEKVGPRVAIEPARVNDCNPLAVDGHHVGLYEQAVLPHVLHQALHGEA